MRIVLLSAAAAVALSMGAAARAQYNPWASQVQLPTSTLTRTLTNGDCGTIIPWSTGSNATVTLPSTTEAGCPVKVIQLGTGAIKAVKGSGATLLSPNNATASIGSMMEMSVLSNAGGSAAQWYISGMVQQLLTPINGDGPQAPTLPPAPRAPLVTYYVSVNGSDANNGTSASTPWQTIGKVNAASFADNTAIAFAGGQTFTGCLVFKAGVNVSNSIPTGGIHLIAYGTGKPTILAAPAATSASTASCVGTGSGTHGPKTATVLFDGVNGVDIEDIIADSNNTGTQYGIAVQDSVNTLGITNVTINGSVGEGSNISTAATGDYSADIIILGYTTAATISSVNQVLIENSVAQGLSLTGTDDAGINLAGAVSASTLVPNTLMNLTNVTIANNTVTNIGGRSSGAYNGGSGNGIISNSAQYISVAYNTVTNSGRNVTTCGGPGGIWAYNVDSINIWFNEVDGMGPTLPAPGTLCDELAYDLDGGVTNGYIQYNHSYNNWGNAWEFYQATSAQRSVWGPNTIRYNISENDSTGTTSPSGGNLSFAGSGVSPSVASAYNNTAYQSTASNNSQVNFFAVPTQGLVANNLFYTAGSIVFIDGEGQNLTPVTFLSNGYYNSASPGSFNVYSAANTGSNLNYGTLASWQGVTTGADAGALLTQPSFVGTPAPAACTVAAGTGPQPCPSAYSLVTGSSYIGAGTTLTTISNPQTIGTQDYYGTAIPNAAPSGENIGAY